jgi:TolB-like protein/DNA-binding winged helix-turn-helix (wHTH) protein/Tfp pilus assembly protein PilF
MSNNTSFFVANWYIEPDILQISQGDSIIKLEPKVMQVLVYLASKPGEVVSRDELEASIWAGRVVGYDALANTIIKLRKAFGDNSRSPQFIKTIPKTGYQLIAEIKKANLSHPETEHKTQTVSVSPTEPVKYQNGVKPLYWMIAILMLGALMFYLSRQPAPLLPEALTTSTSQAKPSIAVLPFVNVGDPVKAYFADGITEDLITELSRLRGLNVVARNSSFSFKNSMESEQSIGKQLQVKYVLKGSIQRSQRQMRINVRLIDTVSGNNLWAERYDAQPGEVFQVQDKLTRHIAAAMQVELAPKDQKRLKDKYIASIEAYDQFLKGLEHSGRRSPEDSQLAKIYFREAIRLDPQFARAYAGLALTYSRDSLDAWGETSRQSLEKAQKLAHQALKIDPTIAQLYFVMSQVKLIQRDYTGAIEEIDQAIQLNPNYADAYALLSWILHFAGRADEGLKVMQRAIQLNPNVPAIYKLVLGALYYSQSDFARAQKILTEGIESSPDFQQLRVFLIAVLAATNQLDEADWQIQELQFINPAFNMQAIEDTFPFKDPFYRQRFLSDLKTAGLDQLAFD